MEESDMIDENCQIKRASVAELDAILGLRWPVLDDGFVRVIDYLGSDQSIVQAARVSYGLGTKSVHEDENLIRYLMRHRHTTPFEMCEIKFHIRVPMDVWRQWIRHRTANVNEYSTRYSVAIDAAVKTPSDHWRLQSQNSKQGSSGFLSDDLGQKLSCREKEIQGIAREVYEERLSLGVAREQARKDLPLSTYTEAYWKIDLHNLMHFLTLRMESHAQVEIRSFANVIGEKIVARWCPLAWKAFLDYSLNSLVLSAQEVALIRLISERNDEAAVSIASKLGWLERHDGHLKVIRERVEAEGKLESLGLPVPWGN